MTYLDSLDALAEGTADKVQTVVASHEEGLITADEAAGLIAAIIAVGNARATVLADLALAADLTVATRTPVPALGLLAPDDTVRLGKAAGTLLEKLPDTPDPVARTRRLGRSEPLTRAGAARGEGIARSPLVQGWTRRTSAKPCQLCTWWSRDGRVWPADHTMPTHKGCTCSQTVVLAERVKPVSR